MAKWVAQWKMEVRKTNLPGVWEKKNGGFVIRGQVTLHGKEHEILKVLHVPTALAALNELSRRKEEKRQEIQTPQALPFAEFVAILLEEKIKAGEHASTTTQTKWETICRKHLFPVFGERRIDTITHVECLTWKHSFLDALNERRLAPRTVNSWLRTMHVIFNAAAPRFSFPNPMMGISDYPIGRVFTEEKPNRLDSKQAFQFLAEFEKRYLDHYAMLLIMLVIGARPSTIRPLRRKGPNADYNRKTGQLFLRRSQVKGAPMDKTKTGLDQSIPLPEFVRNAVNAHIDRLEASTGPMRTSMLLFPNVKDGGFRARSVLDDPMKMICSRLDIAPVTPKGLRRTFKDIARAFKLDKVVEHAISGHKSDEMDFVYGTAFDTEKREALNTFIRAIGLSEDFDDEDTESEESDGEEAAAAE